MKFLTYNEIVDSEVANLTKDLEIVEQIKELKEDELVQYHHTYGRYIRNKYKLWVEDNPLTRFNYKPDLVEDVDFNPKHPDSISMDLIYTIVERIKGV